MATTKTNRNTKRRSESSQHAESPREMTRDLVEYLAEYARDNPGYAALACMGVGFVLGWKLKPW